MAGQIRSNPEEDWVIARDTHEAIITRATFEAAKAIRARRDDSARFRDRLLGRGRTSRFLLSGLITCANCGHKFMGFTQRFREREDRVPRKPALSYVCGGYTRMGRSVCRRQAIEREPFEEFIIGQVETRLTQILDAGGRDLLRRFVREELALADSDPRFQLETVETELRRLKSDADRLLANLTEANREFIDEKLVEIKRRRRELEARREALSRAASASVNLEEATEAALAFLGRFRDVLAKGTFVEQKELLHAFIEGITLNAGEMRGELRMHDAVAMSFRCSGWSRPKLYRLMRRHGVKRNHGRTLE